MVDEIKIKLGFEIDSADLKKEATEAATQLKKTLSEQLAIMSSSMQEGELPLSFLKAAAKRQFSVGGRQFEATGVSQSMLPPGKLGGESINKILINLREVKNKVNQTLTLDARRLKEFSRAIRFEPVKIRAEMIRDFLALNKQVQKSLENAIPSETIQSIRTTLEGAPGLSKTLLAEYKTSLDDLAARIENKPLEEQVQATTKFVNDFTSANKELEDRLKRVEKIRFNELKDSIRGLSLEDQAKAVNEYKESTGALIKDANELTREISEKFRKGAISTHEQRFAAFEASIEELPTQERIAAYKKWIDDGNIFPKKAREKMRALQATRIKEVRVEIEQLPLREREAAWDKLIQEDKDLANRYRAKINNEKQKIQFQILEEQLPSLPIKEQIQHLKDYIAKGGKFSKQARNNLRNAERQLFEEVREEAALLPVGERGKVFQKYIDDGGKFINKAKKEIADDNRAVQEEAFKETKLAANAVGITAQQRKQMWEDYIANGGKFIKAANREIARAERDIERNKFDEAKLQASLTPLRDRPAFWNNITSSDKKIAKKIQLEYNNAIYEVDRADFNLVRTASFEKPFEERVKMFQAIAASNSRFSTEAAREMRRNMKRARAEAAGIEAKRIADLPVEEQVTNWKQFIHTINVTNDKLADYISSGRKLPPPDQIFSLLTDDQILDVIKDNDRIAKIAAARQQKATKKVPRGLVQQLRDLNIGKTYDEQIANWVQFALTYNEFADLANKEIDKVKKQRFKAFKKTIDKLRPVQQAEALEQFGQQFGDEEARVAAQNVRQRREQAARRAQKRRDQRFFERISDLTPEKQLEEIETMMTTSFRTRDTDFNRQLRRRRQALQRNIDRQRASAAQTGRRERANQILLAAGAGLGALGPAGFPLLNVGFAAMSGDVPGAAIVGFTTALGEATRALIAYRDKNIEVAKSIGFVSRTTRRTQAAEEGIQAVVGAFSIVQQTVGQQIRQERFRGTVSRNAIAATSALTTAQEALATTFQDMMGDVNLFRPSNLIPRLGFNLFEQAQRAGRDRPRLLRESIDAFRLEMGRGLPGIETDPYETFKRIQSAAFDPTKSKELDLMQKQLEAAEKQLKELEEGNESWQNAIEFMNWVRAGFNLLPGPNMSF